MSRDTVQFMLENKNNFDKYIQGVPKNMRNTNFFALYMRPEGKKTRPRLK